MGGGGAHGSGFNRLSGSGPGKEVTQGGGIAAFLCFTFVYIIFFIFPALLLHRGRRLASASQGGRELAGRAALQKYV